MALSEQEQNQERAEAGRRLHITSMIPRIESLIKTWRNYRDTLVAEFDLVSDTKVSERHIRLWSSITPRPKKGHIPMDDREYCDLLDEVWTQINQDVKVISHLYGDLRWQKDFPIM